MRFRHFLAISFLATAAGGLSVLAHRYDQLWLAVAALSGAFAGGGAFLHFRNATTNREMEVLREHLEGTRQHAALLARHTRELREAVVDASGGTQQIEFATLSALVRDVADGVAELDKRAEAAESEIVDLRRQSQALRTASASAPGWVAPTRPGGGASHESPGMGGSMNPAAMNSGATTPAAMNSGSMSSSLAPRAGMPPARPAAVVEERAPRPAQSGSLFTQEPPRAVRQLVAAAIAADRFDLYLQRVVGLPQRRMRGYDVTLRPDGSDISIPNSDIRLAVEAVGHQLAFDRKLMIQAVRLARVFEQRGRDVVLFADISQRFLMSEAAFDDLEALVADVPRIAERIVLCLPQRFFKKAVAFEHEALRTLGRMGFSFMMRDIEDLDFDAGKLAQMGVRWLRVTADRFIPFAQDHDTLHEVATVDFVALLARRKLSLIVESVADENHIAELLDLNVEFAQGLAFAPPQAVRADVLEPAPVPNEAPRPEPQPERRTLRDLARRA
jgi:EAL domain-containing protein (putative c-di-GMP-specific phosphodiesterase class I)